MAVSWPVSAHPYLSLQAQTKLTNPKGFAIMLEYAGATNNWSTYFRPIIACPGIIPLILTLLWSRQTKLAAILAPILGLASGVATWLVLSWHWGGAINIQTTQIQLPGLYVGCASV